MTTPQPDPRAAALLALQQEFAKAARKNPGAPQAALGSQVADVEMLPTGVPSLDGALGGGWPKGRITTIAADEGNGKSTLAYTTIAEHFRRRPDGMVLLIDAENSFTPSHARRLGIADAALGRILHVNSITGASGEEMLQAMERVLDTYVDGRCIVDLVVIDSVAALQPRAKLEGDLGDTTMALLARMMSTTIGPLATRIAKAGIPCLLINQLRTDLTIKYGDNKIMPGGKAIPFYSSLILRIGRSGEVTGGEGGKEVIGKTAVFRVKKQRGLFGLTTAEAELTTVRGFDWAKNVLALGRKTRVIADQASYFSVDTLDGPLAKVHGAREMEAALRRLSLPARTDLYDRVVAAAVAQRAALYAEAPEEEDGGPAAVLDDPGADEADAAA